MDARSSFARWALLGLLGLSSSSTTVAHAQDLVPGAYTPAPTGFYVFTIASTFNDGAVAFDSSLPVEDAEARVGWALVGISRTVSLAGRYANIAVGVPLVLGHVEGRVLGVFEETSRTGLGDLVARIGVNVYGAPAMTRQQFAAHRTKAIVGVSLSVGAPIGQYDPGRYINLGTNRWSFKPELGISRIRGRWTFEGDIGAVFFTDNTEFLNDRRREQAPIVTFQGHLIYSIRPAFWISADGNYWKGGGITTDGIGPTEEQKNSRLGLTLAVPVYSHQMRVSYSFGAYTTIGGDFHSVGMSYSYAWAGRP